MFNTTDRRAGLAPDASVPEREDIGDSILSSAAMAPPLRVASGAPAPIPTLSAIGLPV
ncbi:hypothetical protein BN873_p60008 [Candidatus Competibacter denitrificans Run_A_D11]|uniref:Uncharacterized protein n=1 Tax=Candidatus Competibacter denitrificans Run_A_D11 TaxID=1400863 RepID=W6MEK0_9GAMM|nr:hypothetical protein BN873_p60008 [Candidatus Competibacter denitrificans Run_A_D11]